MQSTLMEDIITVLQTELMFKTEILYNINHI